MAISLSISLLTLGAAHAEQYCKSIDKDGNATYTLASDKGCKKMKTVAISHHITPSTPAPKPEATAAAAAPAPASTPTTTPASTGTPPAASTAQPAPAPAPAAAANAPQQIPNK